ncbi:hypothetical protein L6452_32059 [Arctium lappa]|uniref:Uncharacterized protein n=1 Tax=Arctium lappa TaxID=4217 RepID=A0ACB8Z4E0_ARCLA|nr:hypothetical protein L6452_32059 [Arctium lappa]
MSNSFSEVSDTIVFHIWDLYGRNKDDNIRKEVELIWERKALLQIKTSLVDFYDHAYSFSVDPLPSWVDDGSIGGECCDWEGVNCNTTTGHVTDLSLRNIVPEKLNRYCKRNWPLNVYVFLHFKELTRLGRLSSLKKLETLDLSLNLITNEIFPSLGALTSNPNRLKLFRFCRFQFFNLRADKCVLFTAFR